MAGAEVEGFLQEMGRLYSRLMVGGGSIEQLNQVGHTPVTSTPSSGRAVTFHSGLNEENGAPKLKKPVVLPDWFSNDGKIEFEDWVVRVKLVQEVNGWSEEELMKDYGMMPSEFIAIWAPKKNQILGYFVRHFDYGGVPQRWACLRLDWQPVSRKRESRLHNWHRVFGGWLSRLIPLLIPS
jgi:hypothetical protein